MSSFSVFPMQQQQSLPLSQKPQQIHSEGGGGVLMGIPAIRRRLSSLSVMNLKIQTSSSSSSPVRVFQRSTKYAGSSIRKWWQWGLGWILSRKPTFATDLEMNEEETAALGSHYKGSWRHVFFKVTSQLRRKLGGGCPDKLPQTFRCYKQDYNSFNNHASAKRTH